MEDSLQQAAVPLKRDSKCKEVIPFYCSSLAKRFWNQTGVFANERTPGTLARMFHESLTAITDMAVLPGVLGCRPLRRTIQVRLGTNPLWLPGGTLIFVVS
jgi:hypothetical protein